MPKKIKKIKRKDTYPSFLIALLSILVILLVVMVSFFSKPVSDQTSDLINDANSPKTETSTTNVKPKTQSETVTQGPGAQLANTRVKYKIDRFKKLDRQPLEFQVFDSKNKPITPNDLKIVDQAKLHYFVISSNLKEFQHLRPAFAGGKWLTAANLPTPGTYYAYVVYTPTSGREEILRTELIVRNPSSGLPLPTLTTDLKAANGDYIAQLNLQNPVIFQQSKLTFDLKNKNTTAVSNLVSLFGQLGHVVLLREGDPDTFINLYPVSSDAPKGQVSFVTSFSKDGAYIAFAEFKLGTKVYVFPIVFEIKNS